MKKRISKKTLLHDEVQSRISKMLTNKNIFYQNNPVDNTEKNARLIKSFLFRKISSKYPKYNSFTKILTINFSGAFFITATVFFPIEPVEPKIAIFFMIFFFPIFS